MEKSSTLVLTQSELDLFREGKLPERLASEWGYTYQTLKAEVESGNFVVITSPQPDSNQLIY